MYPALANGICVFNFEQLSTLNSLQLSLFHVCVCVCVCVRVCVDMICKT